LLSWLPRAGRLVNQSISEGSHAVAGAITVLALDMYERAYHLDFGPNTVAYVATFMRNIDWSAVQDRYEDAVGVKPTRPLEQKQFGDLPSVTVDELKAMLDSGTPVQIIDTRPRHSSSRAPDIMEGVVWRDPDRVDEWMGGIRP
jgi:Fe-Mn family superoxide dismutase